jgi:polyhydroxyalkanoate synthesis regulator phasin
MAKASNGNPLTDNQLTRLIRGSANQVWHAGVDVYSRAGQEGTRLVDTLFGLGERLDRGAKSKAVGVRDSASAVWERLEDAFVQRVARALNALQIPTAQDVHELNERVQALQQAVVALERRAAKMAPPRRKATRRKASARRAGKSTGTARQAPARGGVKAKA